MLLTSWKTLMFCSIISWGLWGFLGKIVMEKIGWGQAFALFCFTGLLLILLVQPESFRFKADLGHVLGVLMSLFGCLGTIFFYRALTTGPTSVVVPGSALYILIAAVLAFVFLGEAVTLNRILGLGFGLLAIYLLSSG